MHVNADFCHLEFDQPVAGSASRPLLVTSLKSRAFPFIRYRNDDAGIVDAADQCDCGSGFPVMKLTVARESDNFTLPDGRVVHGEFFTHLMYGTRGIERFQFHQVAPSRIVLRVVPEPGSTDAAQQAANDAATELVRQLGRGVEVEVTMTGDIELSAAGKHRFTRSDVKPTLDARSAALETA